MLPFLDILPLSVINAIFTIKPNLGYRGADRLRAVGSIEPHHRSGKQNQQQNACHR
jgi:hypothetical protein